MEICRLCLLHQNHHINIFSGDEPYKNVAKVINQHIGETSESDPLPKYICIECWTKIENFHEYYRRVHEAQNKYLNDLVKQEQDNNFVDIQDQPEIDIHVSHFISVEEFANFDTFDTFNDNDSQTKIERDDEDRNESILEPLIETDVKPNNICINSKVFDDNINDEKVTNAISNKRRKIPVSKTIRSSVENDNIETDEIVIRNSTLKSSSPFNEAEKHQSKYICDICQAVISSKQKLTDHLMRHVSFICQICFHRCTNRKSLEVHKKTEHNHEIMIKLQEQQQKLEKLRISLNEEDFDYVLMKSCDLKCDICNIDMHTTSLQQIKEHYKKEHGIEYGYIKCCGLKLTTDPEVNNHVFQHLYSDQLKCDVCEKVIEDLEKMLTHIEKHIVELEKYPHICGKCNRGFSRKNSLVVHKKYVHGIDEVKENCKLKKPTLADFFTMKCDLCENVMFASLSHAKKHYTTVHGITGYLICCNSKFMKAQTIDDHFQYHLDPSHHKCTYCGKCFERKMTLSAHISKHKALENRKFVCHVCGKAFLSNYYLKHHAIVHDESRKKSYSCMQCDKRYSSSRSLEMHIKFMHTKDGKSKGVICEYCGREFASRSSVVSHIQTVHQIMATSNGSKTLMERSQCSACNASFINKYRLKKHMESIHMGVPQKCSICNKVAPNTAALNCHMRSVHVESIYKCNLCDKSFKAAVALKDHIATHTGEKMYKCSFCPEAFIWRPNMYSHQKKAHPIEWKKSQKMSLSRD